MNALRYIREQLRTMRLGTFFQEEGQEEEWQEPKGVEDHVWTEIRKKGFAGAGSKVRNRDLRRTWERKDKITEHVELLELGKTGGVHSKKRRLTGAMRQACQGGGQRCVVSKVTAEALAPHEGGEAQTVLRKSRITALKCVFDEVKKTFDRWRLGGQYVDTEDCYKHSVSSTANNN